jgi:hypothetical protein
LAVRHPAAAALGVYGGLMAYMLAIGRPEYPVTSALALTVHGLIPAITGALLAVAWGLWRSRHRSTTSHMQIAEPDVTEDGGCDIRA